MKCPHCKKKIEMSHKIWHLEYREDIRNRIIIQTDNESIADLVAPRGASGVVMEALKSIEDCVGAVCLAWGRGTMLHRDKAHAAKTPPGRDTGYRLDDGRRVLVRDTKGDSDAEA